jgi:hypothetical protein
MQRQVACGSCRPDEAGEEENILQQVYLEAQRKYDKKVDFIKSILETSKTKRRVERRIMVVSSLGALHCDVFTNAKKILRQKNRNQDKQAVALLCKRMVKEAIIGSRIIWLRKCGFSFDFDCKHMVKNNTLDEVERKAAKRNVDIDQLLEKNDMFHEELLEGMEQVLRIQRNDNVNYELKEAIE